MNSSFFPIGATYAPLAKAAEVDISEWPQDIENIAKLGLTTFRLFLCWDRVEQVPGVRDFSKVDLAFDLAEKHGLRVIVNMGGTFANLQSVYAPRHLVYDKNCTLFKPKPDSSEVLKSNRFKLCYDDPTYQDMAREFIQMAVARYRCRPSLLAWSGWNEPRISECFCHHSVGLYRQWLKAKYGNLDTLAKAWGTEFPVRYRTWEDVNPQGEANFEAGGYQAYLDWKTFCEQNRRDKFNLIRNWIKQVDVDTPVISHVISPPDADIFGDEDILGTSIYTIHAQGKSADYTPYEFAFRQNVQLLAQGRRNHRNDPEGFWVVETEAGPVSWVHNLIPRSYSPRQMNVRDMLYVSYGARAILRWLYRSRVSDAQAGEFNLVGWDGRITPRAAEFGKLSQFLNKHAEQLRTHVTRKSGVYILDNQDCRSLAEAETFQGRYNEVVHGVHNALLHIGVRGETCNARQIREGVLDNANVLILPFRPYVDSWMAEKFRRFVERGGTLIADSPFAIKNTSGIHYEVTPGLLTDVFGAQVYDLEALHEPACGGVPAFDFRAHIEVKGGKVEGCFSDGEPAIVTNKYGKGKTVLFASMTAIAYRIDKAFWHNEIPVLSWEQGEAYREKLSEYLNDAGVDTQWVVRCATDADKRFLQIVPRILPGGKALYFIMNFDRVGREFSLKLKEGNALRVLGCSAESEYAGFCDGEWQIKLDEWGWTILTGE